MSVIVTLLLHLRDVRADGVLQEVPEILCAESYEKLLGAVWHAVVLRFFDERVANVVVLDSQRNTSLDSECSKDNEDETFMDG